MMSGLDRIIEKINADSLASCREIADQAQKKAQDIAEDANAHAEKAYSDIIEIGRASCRERVLCPV